MCVTTVSQRWRLQNYTGLLNLTVRDTTTVIVVVSTATRCQIRHCFDAVLAEMHTPTVLHAFPA